MGVKGTLYAAQEMLAGQKKEASRKGHGRYDGTWNWKEHDGWGGRFLAPFRSGRSESASLGDAEGPFGTSV